MELGHLKIKVKNIPSSSDIQWHSLLKWPQNCHVFNERLIRRHRGWMFRVREPCSLSLTIEFNYLWLHRTHFINFFSLQSSQVWLPMLQGVFFLIYHWICKIVIFQNNLQFLLPRLLLFKILSIEWVNKWILYVFLFFM